MKKQRIILASSSPRRQDLLATIGLDFEVIPCEVDESAPGGLAPAQLVAHLAAQKARDVASRHPGALVIGADTVVVLEGDVLGKPKDAADAQRMLRRLSGNSHRVLTGLCVIDANGGEHTHAEETLVTLAVLSDREIDAYVATGEPLDKAGGYGIQGRAGIFVERVEGCYSNVVGLPLHALRNIFIEIGVPYGLG